MAHFLCGKFMGCAPVANLARKVLALTGACFAVLDTPDFAKRASA
jgi:hypothetical protein